jgi:hypothetical protein
MLFTKYNDKNNNDQVKEYEMGRGCRGTRGTQVGYWLESQKEKDD